MQLPGGGGRAPPPPPSKPAGLQIQRDRGPSLEHKTPMNLDQARAAEMNNALQARLATHKQKEDAAATSANPGVFQIAAPPKKRGW